MNIQPPGATTSLTCRDCMRYMSLRRDGLLHGHDSLRVHAHIQSCVHCQVASRHWAMLFAGLDRLLARSKPEPVLQPRPQSTPLEPALIPARLQGRRHTVVGLGLGASLGAVLGVGVGAWWGPVLLQSAQSTPNPTQTIALQIAQYQSLYTRATVADAIAMSQQHQRILQLWTAQVHQAGFVRKAPAVQGLQLARTQRLGSQHAPILQWVYLPRQGAPVALCGLPAPIGPSAPGRPTQTFQSSNMQGVHWQDRGLLWVLVAPKAQWTVQQILALQRHMALQLQAQT